MKSPFCKCGDLVRANQRNCYRCHAKSVRDYRRTHQLTSEQRMKMNARSYLHVYIKRGVVSRKPCVLCGTFPAEPHHTDYSKPLQVVWLCKFHHLYVEGKKLYKPSRTLWLQKEVPF